jgi:hypothetical protein
VWISSRGACSFSGYSRSCIAIMIATHALLFTR